MLIVYTIEDEKYGTQAIFKTEEAAGAAVKLDKYNISGNVTIIRWAVEE